MNEETENIGIGTRVQHARHGVGVVTGVKAASLIITFIDYGTKELQRDDNQLEITHTEEINSEIETLSEQEKSLLDILRMWNGIGEIIPLGDKWKGGKMILVPGQTGMQQKEIPIDMFFHKIVMLRDRLRVLEQNVNSNSKLSDEDKVNLQQYITRIYGSLTTFNILFKQKEQNFIGEKGSKED